MRTCALTSITCAMLLRAMKAKRTYEAALTVFEQFTNVWANFSLDDVEPLIHECGPLQDKALELFLKKGAKNG